MSSILNVLSLDHAGEMSLESGARGRGIGWRQRVGTIFKEIGAGARDRSKTPRQANLDRREV